MLTHDQASLEIHKLANAVDVLGRALDNLWPKLPLDAMQRLNAVPLLEAIDANLAKRLRQIAEDVQEEGDACVASQNELADEIA